jgi:molecular chaperone DnaK
MMKEAEQYAEEDRKRRDEAETRNSSEALVFQTEKFLGENGDKLPAEGKADVESALTDLKAALGGSDIAAIKSAAEKVATKSQELGGALYAQQAADGSGPAGAAAGPGSDDGLDDGVVDAEVVEDEAK